MLPLDKDRDPASFGSPCQQSLSHGCAVPAPFAQGSLGTGDADFRNQRPKFWDKIWGGGQVVGPYRKPNQPPKPAGAQRSVRARVGEGWAGISAKAIPNGGPPPQPPRQRLAKRKARKEQLVKSGLCPISELCSTAYRVRKSDENPARAPVGAALIEQDRLVPHPAARQGASRARNCAATKRFFF